RRLSRFGIGTGGTMLRDNLWSHAAMPAVTVEAAYLTNKNDAEELTKDNVKEAIAAGITAGIEAQSPGIQSRKAELLKYRQLSATSASAHRPTPLPGLSLPRGLPIFQLGVAMAALCLLVRFRRATIPVIAFAVALASVARARAGGRPAQRTRRGVRRRRSRAPLWSDVRTY
ncbi:MAG: N-acetylmuramoyl-L-alanine amidase, partial [Candidatus Dormibacteraeota bacterium]|nr:N-acetylmuramoyl-L-alanine amidase [Candidatus Dormibacteraeota bacterium]